ncbi:U2 snRNP auxiliary factor large subunit [Gracilaria domingensis]|nr:U2 snRNP auxiliary factor large subunit [Gracilaria domingensis]
MVVNLFAGHISFLPTVIYGLQTAVLTALGSIVVDSHFWQRLSYPELEVFYFNVVLNKSSAWGTHPFLWYFYNALPRALGGSYILGLKALIAGSGEIGTWMLPALLFVCVYSILPHKELRFIFYVLPVFNAAAAVAIETEIHRIRLMIVGSGKKDDSSRTTWRLADLLRAVLFAGFVVLTFASCIAQNVVSSAASQWNYPSAHAMMRMHEVEHILCAENATLDGYVHIDVDSAMGGISQFVQESYDKKSSCWKWRYSKREDVEDLKLTDFSHLLWNRAEVEGFCVIHVEEKYAGVDWQKGRIKRSPHTYVHRNKNMSASRLGTHASKRDSRREGVQLVIDGGVLKRYGALKIARYKRAGGQPITRRSQSPTQRAARRRPIKPSRRDEDAHISKRAAHPPMPPLTSRQKALVSVFLRQRPGPAVLSEPRADSRQQHLQTSSRMEHSRRERRASPPRRRRRRPTLWDVREFPYGIPVPPAGGSTAFAPHAVRPVGLTQRVEANRAPIPGPNDIVHAPVAGESGPLAGINIDALKALLNPSGVRAATPAVAIATPVATMGEANMQSTRHARRLYVGNLPADTTDVQIEDFFNRALKASRGVESEGNAVISVYTNLEKRFAFIETRTIREAAAGLALDGVKFGDMFLRLRRPNDYNATLAGDPRPPAGFNPSILGIVSTQVSDGPNKVAQHGDEQGLCVLRVRGRRRGGRGVRGAARHAGGRQDADGAARDAHERHGDARVWDGAFGGDERRGHSEQGAAAAGGVARGGGVRRGDGGGAGGRRGVRGDSGRHARRGGQGGRAGGGADREAARRRAHAQGGGQGVRQVCEPRRRRARAADVRGAPLRAARRAR